MSDENWVTVDFWAGETVEHLVLDTSPYNLSTPHGKCCVCKESDATEVVIGCPGAVTYWCRKCSLLESIKTCKKHIDHLSALEKELIELEEKEKNKMRKFFFDTEFMEEPGFLQLISIGVVGEDDSEFYAISAEADLSKANDWVKENVIPKLDMTKAISMEEIRKSLLEFLNPSEEDPVQMYGYYADYDHVLFCWIFGKMVDLPPGIKMYSFDLKQAADTLFFPKDLYPKQENEHDALDDAKWNKRLYNLLFVRK